ncbi:MAG: restriction endonuclease subunit S [Phycisphaeraceae bacterium]|nr:restriction endonuclease subunit S [Phycisphaeraceae bacterium]
MPTDWTTFRLGNVCSKIGSGATPRGGGSVYLAAGDVALIRSQNVYNGGFHHDGLAYLTETHAEELENVAVKAGDVLLNITGDSVARCCQVDPEVLPARVNQHVAIIRPNPGTLDAKFLRYFLVSPGMQADMLSWGGAGATRNALTKGMIEAFEIPAPRDVGEQRAIAGVLGALDDKIEVNRKMARVLEGIARAVFTSWFVDFDPVHYNIRQREHAALDRAGRFVSTGDDFSIRSAEGQLLRRGGDAVFGKIAGLFPDRLVDSPLGEVPEGWRVGTLGDVASERRDGIAPEDIQADTAYIALEHMPRRCISLSDWSVADDVASGKLVFAAGDILFGKLRPYFHKVGVAPLDGVCSTDIIVMRPKSPEWSAYALGIASSDEFVAYTDRGSAGTKMPRTNWTDMAAYPIVVPPAPLAAAYNKVVAPMIGRMIAGTHANRTLAALRDTLLPKLISGELRIADAETIVGRVV